jgi:hypothetical protein
MGNSTAAKFFTAENAGWNETESYDLKGLLKYPMLWILKVEADNSRMP